MSDYKLCIVTAHRHNLDLTFLFVRKENFSQLACFVAHLIH